MTIKLPGLTFCFAVLAVSTAAQAQMSPGDLGATMEDIASGGRLALGLEAGAMYTDNFYYTAVTEESAFGGILKPAVAYLMGLPRFRFAASGSGEFGFFNTDSDEDNYSDFVGRLQSSWQPASRHGFSYGYTYQADHDPFGTERTEIATTTHARNIDQPLDKWNTNTFDAGYHYGEAGSQFAVDVRVGMFTKEYTTNRSVTGSNFESTRFLDYNDVNGAIALFYNVSPKTAFLVDAVASRPRVEEVKPGTHDRGANEYRYRTGVRWLASAKTTGDIRLGYVTRDPVDSGLPSFSAFDWQAAVGWSPESTHLLTFQTGRNSTQSYQLDSAFFNNRYYTVEWAHEWTERLRTRAAVGYLQTEFEGASRNDDVITGSLSGEFKWTRELGLLGALNYGNRDTSTAGLDYSRFASYIGVRYVR